MKKVLLLLLAMALAGSAQAVEVAGIDLPDDAEVAGEELQLNGYGIRKKFVFVKVYIGSLYTSAPASTLEDVLELPGPKLIRMDFLYNKVDREKIVDAFAEGFEKNSPQLVATPAARAFLGLFRNDFVADDRVDLILKTDGAVSAIHNGETLGTVDSAELVEGVLRIYLGEQPADAAMKAGMLGKK